MELDIRTCEAGNVNCIRVANADRFEDIVEVIALTTEGVYLNDVSADMPLRVSTKEHAQDIIKGLKKAIELGWFPS